MADQFTLKRMRFASFFCVLLAGCLTQTPKVEKMENSQPVPLALEFDSLFGVRDADAVKATAVFKKGPDSAMMAMELFLGPPARFVSGSYRITADGKTDEGSVEASSLTFLGGQGSLPSVGGVFMLNDRDGRPVYRITMPPTPIQRKR